MTKFDLFNLPLIAGAETQPAEAPAEGTPEEGATETQTPEFDLSPVTDRMDEVLDRVGALEQRIPEGDPEHPQGAPEDEFADYYGPEQQEWTDPQQLDPTDPNIAQQIIQSEVQRGVREALEPELQRQAEERRIAEGEALLEDYPELNEGPAAQGLVNDAQQWAQDITRDLARSNPQLAQRLVGEPAFLELVHLAAKQAEAAEGETPPGQAQEVTLESGAPANPGGAEPQANLGERIKSAGRPPTFFTG